MKKFYLLIFRIFCKLYNYYTYYPNKLVKPCQIDLAAFVTAWKAPLADFLTKFHAVLYAVFIFAI